MVFNAISEERSKITQATYDAVFSKIYDHIQNHMIRLKKPAVNELNLTLDDKVISFCCGTGQEFPFIQQKIGQNGKILGIDYSKGMLDRAQKRNENNNWNNVSLVYSDVLNLPDKTFENGEYDAGICTLGLSIIPDPQYAFKTLKNAIKPGGRIVVGDIQSFTGITSLLNPLLTIINSPFGNNYQSLKESRAFENFLKSELKDFKKQEYLCGCYYIASGTK